MYSNDYRVLSNFISKILLDQPVTIYGDGKQTRTFCYITDAMKGFFRVLLRGTSGEVYNIGNPKPEINMIQLADKLYKACEKENMSTLIPYPDTYPDDEPRRRCPDISKATRELDYNPAVEIQEGLRRMYKWAELNYFTEKEGKK